ncbi:MAG: ribonuclease III family protein [Candidatus Helarchaeota archaeon]
MIRKDLRNIIPELRSFKEIFLDKNLAKIGDIFVNFIYSISKSIVINKITGEKVAGKILMQALRDSDLNQYVPARLTKHDIADAVEALIFYVWALNLMKFNEMIDILVSELSMGDFSTRTNEFDTAILAFTKLLNKISELNIFDK